VREVALELNAAQLSELIAQLDSALQARIPGPGPDTRVRRRGPRRRLRRERAACNARRATHARAARRAGALVLWRARRGCMRPRRLTRMAPPFIDGARVWQAAERASA
jgi:hypothetical protein